MVSADYCHVLCFRTNPCFKPSVGLRDSCHPKAASFGYVARIAILALADMIIANPPARFVCIYRGERVHWHRIQGETRHAGRLVVAVPPIAFVPVARARKSGNAGGNNGNEPRRCREITGLTGGWRAPR